MAWFTALMAMCSSNGVMEARRPNPTDSSMKPASGRIVECPKIRNTASDYSVASLMHYATSLSWSGPWASTVLSSYASGIISYSGRAHSISGATLLA